MPSFEDFYSTSGHLIAVWVGFFCFASSPLNIDRFVFGIGFGLFFWLILSVVSSVARRYKKKYLEQ